MECFSELAQLPICSVVQEYSSLSIVFRATALVVQMETGKSSVVCTGFFVCSVVWEEESIDRAVEANRNFGETSTSLTISRSCVSTAVQEEVQTKKRSSERAACDVHSIVAPPHPVLP